MKIPKAIHPKPDDKGQAGPLYQPHAESDPACWGHPERIATFIPRGLGGDCPHQLYGVPFTPWRDHPKTIEEWNRVEGQRPSLPEPPLPEPPPGKRLAAGVVIEEADGRIWTVSPSNQFGGYVNTLPKGTLEDGINPQAAAIKEAFEETGLKVAITGYLADIERSTSITRYYRARRVGGDPTDMGWESQAVHLVPRAQLAAHLTSPYDQPLVALLQDKRNR